MTAYNQHIQKQPSRMRPRPLAVFDEHSASDGVNTIGVLKFVGVLIMIGSGLMALLGLKAAAEYPVGLFIVLAIFMQGVVLCALFFAVATIAENLVAIRKNTAHLAGVRANTAQHFQIISQQVDANNEAPLS